MREENSVGNSLGNRDRSPINIWLGVLFVLISTAFYGSIPAVIAFHSTEMPLIDVLTYRGIAAGFVLLFLHTVFSRLRYKRADVRPLKTELAWHKSNRGLFIGAFLYTPQLLLFYSAIEHVETSLAVALSYIYPTIVIILVAVRKSESPALRDLGLSLSVLLGIIALTNPGSGSTVETIGIVLVFFASAFFAVYVVAVSEAVESGSPALKVGGQVSLGVGATLVLYGLVVGELSWPASQVEWGNLAIQAFMLVVAITFYLLGLAKIGATTASLIDGAQPLVAILVGGWLLGEQLVAIQVVGVILVTTSVAVTTLVTQRNAEPKNRVPFSDSSPDSRRG